MKKVIFFVGFNNDYDKIDIEVLENNYETISFSINRFYLKIHRLGKKLAFLRFLSHFVSIYFKKKIDKKFVELNADLVLFKDDYDYVNFFQFCLLPKVLIIRNSRNSDFFDKYNIEKNLCYSFDYKDCNINNIKKYNQYTSGKYLYDKYNININITCDVTFLGKDKNRRALLDEIRDTISKKWETNFFIVDDHSTNSFTYIEYLKFQLSGRAILDVVKDGQSSETMRFLEALSTGRKVITNNDSVRNHELFNENNVLVFNTIDELSQNINEFLLLPNLSYEKSVLNKYSSYFVLGKIIEENT